MLLDALTIEQVNQILEEIKEKKILLKITAEGLFFIHLITYDDYIINNDNTLHLFYDAEELLNIEFENIRGRYEENEDCVLEIVNENRKITIEYIG